MLATGVEAIANAGPVRAQGSAGLSLDVLLGKIAGHMERDEHRRDRLYELIHVVPIMGALGASGTIDFPDMLGPKDGYLWALLQVAASGFTAGSVALYANDMNSAQIAAWSSAGVWDFGGKRFLMSRDRLIFVASSITGTVQVSGQAIELSQQVLPEFLL